MKIPKHFTRHTTTAFTTKDGECINMKTFSCLIPQLHHYAAIIYPEITEQNKHVFADTGVVSEAIKTVFKDTDGVNGPLAVAGVKELSELYASELCVPKSMMSRKGVLPENVSVCLVYPRPSATELSPFLQWGRNSVPGFWSVQIPIEPVSETSLQEILQAHLRFMDKTFLVLHRTIIAQRQPQCAKADPSVKVYRHPT